MRKMKNNLDERQEQMLLKIEHNGCWLAFWGLFAVQAIQLILFGYGDIRYLAGEWVVFMGLALYLCIACIRHGIWDRRLKADKKTNFLMSLLAGSVAGLILAAVSYIRYSALIGTIAVFVFVFLFTAVLCYIALSLCVKAYEKKKQELEKSYEE